MKWKTDFHQRTSYTPWKINMEPTNHVFRKENDLPNLHDYVMFHVNLPGCIQFPMKLMTFYDLMVNNRLTLGSPFSKTSSFCCKGLIWGKPDTEQATNKLCKKLEKTTNPGPLVAMYDLPRRHDVIFSH